MGSRVVLILCALLFGGCSAAGSGPPATPQTMPAAAVASGGIDLFVANQGAAPANVTAYAPGSVSPALTMHKELAQPTAMTVDSNGNLFVAGNFYGDAVTEYYSKDGRVEGRISAAVSWPNALAEDSHDQLYVSNCNCPPYDNYPGWVSVYPGFGAPERILSVPNELPAAIALDARNRLYVANLGFGFENPSILVYDDGGGSTPDRIIKTGLTRLSEIALAGNGTLYAANEFAGGVQVYAPGASTPSRVLQTGLSNPSLLAVDAQNDAYVGSYDDDKILEYDPHGTLLRTITEGIVAPTALALSPR